jgi:hypothetical protein
MFGVDEILVRMLDTSSRHYFFWLAVPLIFDAFLLGNLPVGKSMEGTVLSPLLERQPNLGDSKICKDISRHMSPGCPGSIFNVMTKID